MIDGVVVFGRQGQVARSLAQLLPSARFLGSQDCDFNRPELIASILEREQPKLIVNAAAYTEVDKAESEPERAFAINATAPGEIAKWCAHHQVPLIHYSTDYVYSGEGLTPWRESDLVAPCNVYGESKLKGEKAIVASGARHYILRTSWVFSAHGKNFLKTMMNLGKEREQLRIVADQVGGPTYAADLAKATLQMVQSAAFDESSGIFNVCNDGETSWYDFALEIFKSARRQGAQLRIDQVDAITSREYPTPARRPLNSRLNSEKFRKTFGIGLPQWEDAVDRCLKELLAST